MLAQLERHLPRESQWRYEPKQDGFRLSMFIWRALMYPYPRSPFSRFAKWALSVRIAGA
jgi:ATP-dependent DNA ligase